MSSYTPGPWAQGNARTTARDHAISAGAVVIARVSGMGYPTGLGWHPASAANAQLIAAAPDIAEALSEIVNNPPGERRPDWLERARAALAKAGVS